MSRCPECGTDHPEGDDCVGRNADPTPRRCERCGERFQDVDACPACGRLHEAVACDVHGDTAAEGRCVVCGRALCRECQRGDSRVHLCAEHANVNVIQGWAQVYTTTREIEARLLVENLQAEGIEARIFSQRDNMLTVDLGELSIVRVLVPVWDYEKAVGLIRDHMDESGEVTFACPECGEAYDPGSETCAACGAVLT